MIELIPLDRLLTLADPLEFWPWGIGPSDREQFYECFARIAPSRLPVEQESSWEDHVARIKHLVLEGWSDAIEIDVGVPCLGYPGPDWIILDGNHRVVAATLRKFTHISADVAGQTDYLNELFGEVF